MQYLEKVEVNYEILLRYDEQTQIYDIGPASPTYKSPRESPL